MSQLRVFPRQAPGSLDRRRLIQLAAAGALMPASQPMSLFGRPRQAAQGSAKPKLRLLIPEGSQANLAPVVKAFQKARGVTVELISCGVDDVATEMTLRALAGASDFDMALPATFSIPDLVELEVIQPMDHHLPGGIANGEPRSLFPLGDRYKGKTYGLQTDGDVYLMFYNRRMLKDADQRARFEDRLGRELAVPRTWQELDEAMEFFHAPDEEQYGGALFRSPSYMAWEFWIRLHAKGVFPVNDELRPLIQKSEGIEAAEEMIRASRWLVPNAESAGLFENWETFTQGNTFCNIGWGGSQKYFRRPDSPIRDSLTVASTPGGILGGAPVTIPYFNWGWNYTISNATEHPELCAEFAAFATSGQAAIESVRARDSFFDPFLDSHYSDKEIVETYTKPFLDEHRNAMATAIPDFYLAGRGEYFDLLGRFLARANSGKISAKEALTIVAKGWELITERYGRANQVTQWQFLKARYPAGVGKHLRSE